MATYSPEYRMNLKSASGDYLKIFGQVESLPVRIDEDVEVQLDLVVAEISEDIILGNAFLLRSAAALDYGTLTMKCENRIIPLIQPSNKRVEGVVKSVMDKRLSGKTILTCVIESESLQLPGSFVYHPEQGKWESDKPSVINVCDNVIEILIDTETPYMMKKNEVVGTISEVDKMEMREEAATWKWTKEKRVQEIWNQLKLAENDLLSEEQKERAKKLIEEYHEVFSISKKEIGLTNMYVHKIKLKKEGLVINKNRPIPMHKFAEAQKTMKDLIDMGVLEPSTSKNRSNLVLVNKKDGTKRFTADLRTLNDMIEDCEHPMPTVWETRNIWSGCKWFSVLDLSSAYYQIPLDEHSRDYTTIWVNGIGSYRFTRAPMGMKSSGTALQSLTDKLFQDVKKEVCCNFQDDIISGSKTVDGMLNNLKIIFKRLRMGRLKVRTDKTNLFKDHVTYLGCKLNEEGLRANMDKVGVLLNLEKPKTRKEVQKFLGLAGYFREFIPVFADKSAGLRKLLVKGAEFKFDDEAEASFNGLKKALVTPPVLAWPNEEKEFHLFTDVSDVATGFFLAQYNDEGKLHPVCYGSRSFNANQQHWASFVKEYYAIYSAVDRLRYYLFGKKFTLHTDCQALMFEKTLRKCTSNAVLRWSIELSQFTFEIKYIAGKDNVVSDSLSRLPQKSSEIFDYLKMTFSDIGTEAVLTINEQDENPSPENSTALSAKEDQKLETPLELEGKVTDYKRVREEQIHVTPAVHIGNEKYLKLIKTDKLLNKVKKWVTGEEKIGDPAMLGYQERQYANKLDLLHINDQGLLCRKYFSKKLKTARYLISVPGCAIRKVIEFYHEKAGCHLAADKTRDRILQKFYFPNYFEEIKLFCRTCSPCFKVNLKYHKRESAKLKPFIYKYPGLCVAMDVVGIKKGTKEIKVLTLVDRFTKWVNFSLIKDEKAETIARALMNNWICLWGPPEILVSDNAKSFKESKIMQHVYKLMGIEKKYSSPYHPEGNGSAERFNRILVDLLSKLVQNKPHTWKTKLPKLSMAVNSAINRSTGYSAFTLMTGREMPGLDNIVFDTRTTEYFQSEDHLVDANYQEMKKIFEIAGDNLELTHKLQKKVFDRNKTCMDLKQGDRVLLYRPVDTQNDYHKLGSCWTGPYRIIKTINDHNYHLQREKDGLIRIAHRNHIRKIPTGMRGELARDEAEDNLRKEDDKTEDSSTEASISSEGDSDTYIERFEDEMSRGAASERTSFQSLTKYPLEKRGTKESICNTEPIIHHTRQRKEVRDETKEKVPKTYIPPMVIMTPLASSEVAGTEDGLSTGTSERLFTRTSEHGTEKTEIPSDRVVKESSGSSETSRKTSSGDSSRTGKSINGPGPAQIENRQQDEQLPGTSSTNSLGHRFKKPRYTENLQTPHWKTAKGKGRGKRLKESISTPVKKLLSKLHVTEGPRRSKRNVGKPKINYNEDTIEEWEF